MKRKKSRSASRCGSESMQPLSLTTSRGSTSMMGLGVCSTLDALAMAIQNRMALPPTKAARRFLRWLARNQNSALAAAQTRARVGSKPRILTKRMPQMTASSGGISGSWSLLEIDSKLDGEGDSSITGRVWRGGECSQRILEFRRAAAAMPDMQDVDALLGFKNLVIDRKRRMNYFSDSTWCSNLCP